MSKMQERVQAATTCQRTHHWRLKPDQEMCVQVEMCAQEEMCEQVEMCVQVRHRAAWEGEGTP